MAAARLVMVEAFRPASARNARYAAVVSIEAGSGSYPRCPHHVEKWIKSERYARLVAAAFSDSAYLAAERSSSSRSWGKPPFDEGPTTSSRAGGGTSALAG